MINVTQTFLPDLEEYQRILKRAWDKKWLTNRGELLLELEMKLKEYLIDVPDFFITTNGTLPIQIAIKALSLKGEIITTPFSYVATTSAIIWEGCTPVFVDIEANTLTIDPKKIEAVITDKTTAIIATHVFGNPCDVIAIEAIAKKHDLKVVYDAAHCFAVRYKDKSLFSYGDISTTSFHATKLFHTGEGGALFVSNPDWFKKMYYHHNFGHNGPTDYHGIGINAKASEMQAAMGLAVLPYMDEVIEKRRKISCIYEDFLSEVSGIELFECRKGTKRNYAYMPILFESEEMMQRVMDALEKKKVKCRRYFYPSLNTLAYLDNQVSMPISEDVCSRILCLPLYAELSHEDVYLISKIILENIS